MSLFIVETEKSPIVENFCQKINRKSVLLVNQKTKIYPSQKNSIILVDLKFGVPPIFLLGFLFVPLGFLFWKPMIYIGSFFLLTSFLFWSGFHYWAFKKGLRKEGYKGLVKRLSLSEGVRRLLL